MGFWTVQGLWAWIVLLPVTAAQVVAPTAPLTALNWLAAGLAASGFLFEAVADAQKFSFKNKPENKGRCALCPCCHW